MNIMKLIFSTSLSESRLDVLKKMDYNQIMHIEDDHEFIWALYLKVYTNKNVNIYIDENLREYNILGECYKNIIIGRINSIAVMRTPTSTIPVLVTALFALYTVFADVNKIFGIMFLVQALILILLTVADYKEKSYKAKCKFLIEVFK